ncbi:MAG: hypothetical protein JWO56_2693 [Acidobacteria bacterium]|nr:hypothetical protein [Acidobacteriota bacterium]
MANEHSHDDGPAHPPGDAPDAPTASPPSADPPPKTSGVGGEADHVLSVQTINLDGSAIRADEVEIEARKPRGLWVVREEVVRAAVALLLLGLLTYIVVEAFQRAKSWDDTKELLDTLLPAVTALLGSAVGFYFGTKAN